MCLAFLVDLSIYLYFETEKLFPQSIRYLLHKKNEPNVRFLDWLW